jgi:hypothetical protein
MSILKIVIAQLTVLYHAAMLLYWQYVETAQRLAIGEVDYEHSQKVRGYQVALELSKLKLDEVLS